MNFVESNGSSISSHLRGKFSPPRGEWLKDDAQLAILRSLAKDIKSVIYAINEIDDVYSGLHLKHRDHGMLMIDCCLLGDLGAGIYDWAGQHNRADRFLGTKPQYYDDDKKMLSCPEWMDFNIDLMKAYIAFLKKPDNHDHIRILKNLLSLSPIQSEKMFDLLKEQYTSDPETREALSLSLREILEQCEKVRAQLTPELLENMHNQFLPPPRMKYNLEATLTPEEIKTEQVSVGQHSQSLGKPHPKVRVNISLIQTYLSRISSFLEDMKNNIAHLNQHEALKHHGIRVSEKTLEELEELHAFFDNKEKLLNKVIYHEKLGNEDLSDFKKIKNILFKMNELEPIFDEIEGNLQAVLATAQSPAVTMASKDLPLEFAAFIHRDIIKLRRVFNGTQDRYGLSDIMKSGSIQQQLIQLAQNGHGSVSNGHDRSVR